MFSWKGFYSYYLKEKKMFVCFVINLIVSGWEISNFKGILIIIGNDIIIVNLEEIFLRVVLIEGV